MHQGAFLGANWTVRRKLSVATYPRRTYHHGTQWNVQVVRGKVTTRCLWNACKALTLGLLLMLMGCIMATVGYYADQLSVAQEVRGNSTVRVKNESRGFHLNNLSYAGPIVMGVGGFIVVASCVMTFEARDSAAKVVPARYKPGSAASMSLGHQRPSPQQPAARQASVRAGSTRRTAGCQTRWDAAGLGLYQHAAAEGGASPCGSDAISRRALTAAFVQFSRALQHRQPSTESAGSHGRLGAHHAPASAATSLNKSPSAPNLTAGERLPSPQPSPSATRGRPRGARPARPARTSLRPSCAFLSPRLLQRQALSMDAPGCRGCGCRSPPLGPRSGRSTRSGSRESLELGASAGAGGSQVSMAMDLHLPDDCPVTLAVRDESRRRRPLTRQRPVDEEAARPPPLRCRANTAEARRPPQRSGSVSLNYSRSNVDDYRRRRDSISSELGRRPRRASLSKASALRPSEGLAAPPYTISRPVIEGEEPRAPPAGRALREQPHSLQELRVCAAQGSSDSADTQVTRLSPSSHASRQQLELDLVEAAPQPGGE